MLAEGKKAERRHHAAVDGEQWRRPPIGYRRVHLTARRRQIAVGLQIRHRRPDRCGPRVETAEALGQADRVVGHCEGLRAAGQAGRDIVADPADRLPIDQQRSVIRRIMGGAAADMPQIAHRQGSMTCRMSQRSAPRPPAARPVIRRRNVTRCRAGRRDATPSRRRRVGAGRRRHVRRPAAPARPP